jgi:hypothetical protein
LPALKPWSERKFNYQRTIIWPAGTPVKRRVPFSKPDTLVACLISRHHYRAMMVNGMFPPIKLKHWRAFPVDIAMESSPVLELDVPLNAQPLPDR